MSIKMLLNIANMPIKMTEPSKNASLHNILWNFYVQEKTIAGTLSLRVSSRIYANFFPNV